jgi:hypothetical protein
MLLSKTTDRAHSKYLSQIFGMLRKKERKSNASFSGSLSSVALHIQAFKRYN